MVGAADLTSVRAISMVFDACTRYVCVQFWCKLKEDVNATGGAPNEILVGSCSTVVVDRGYI